MHVMAQAALPHFFFFSPGSHVRHMEVPRVGVGDPSCICDLDHSPRQRQILNPLSESRDRIRVLTDAG